MNGKIWQEHFDWIALNLGSDPETQPQVILSIQNESRSLEYCSVNRPADKPCQWKSMLYHQGWFIVYTVYRLHFLQQVTTGFLICILH